MKTKTRPSVNLFLLTFFSFLLSISSAFEKKNKVFEAAELLINQINKNVHANDKTASFMFQRFFVKFLSMVISFHWKHALNLKG